MTATITRDQADQQAYEALQAAGGNITQAAKTAGMPRTSFKTAVARHTARVAQDELAEAPVVTEPSQPGAPAAEAPEAAGQEATGNPCACECGATTARTFVRGHDSRYGKKLRAAYVAGQMTRDEVLAAAGAISTRFHGKLVKSLRRADEAAAKPAGTRRVRQPQWLVETHLGGLEEEEGVPFHLVLQTTDAATAFQLAEAKYRDDTGNGFLFGADELEEVVPGYLWQAADGSSIAYEVRNLSAV